MFWFKDKKRNKMAFFVFASLLNFVALFLFFFLVGSSGSSEVYKRTADAAHESALNKNDGVTDPFITRNPDLSDKNLLPAVDGDDPAIGPDNAEVDLIFFSDFDCEFCRRQYEAIKDVMKGNEESVRLVWKDYPDAEVDSRSWQAALAGRCAHRQGKFWEYYDTLFTEPEAFFTDVAGKAGLDVGEFSECLAGRPAADDLKESLLEADSLRIVGVPYLLVNGREMLGEVSRDELETLIEFEKNRSDK